MSLPSYSCVCLPERRQSPTLQEVMQAANLTRIWLPIQGPSFRVDPATIF